MWWIGIPVVGLGVLAWLLLRKARAGTPLVSIVMMRRTLRKLTEAEVRQAIRRATGRMDVDVKPGPLEMPGLAATFVVLLKDFPAFFVLCVDRPYGEDTEAESRQFEDPGARKAYAEHRAWIAVDLAHRVPRGEVGSVAQLLQCRFAAELLDEGCTLLYSTALGRFALPGPETEAALRGEQPMSIFGDTEVNTPMINVSGDDEKIQRAIAEAQRRWPEFVAAWQRGGTACKGMAKGRFPVQGVEGVENEYLWLEVVSLAGDSVTGTVANRPVHLPGLEKGREVTVSAANVVDWVYLDGEKPRGFFVERVLQGK